MRKAIAESSQERRIIKRLQQHMNMKLTGELDYNFFLDLSARFGILDEELPIMTNYYGVPVMLAKNFRIIISKTCNALCASYPMSFSGSYCFKDRPDHIFIYKGNVLNNNAYYKYRDFPEMVIYKKTNGEFGKKICFSADELDVPSIDFAIGGYDISYGSDLSIYGVTDGYDNILKPRDNIIIGYKNNIFYISVLHGYDAHFVSVFCKDVLRIDDVIMLSGGKDLSFNGGEEQYQYNCFNPHLYLIQAV